MDEPVDRAQLMAELYRLLPRVVGILDLLPKDEMGGMGRAKLQPEVDKLLQLKTELETLSTVMPERLQAGRAHLRHTLTRAVQLSKLCSL